MSDKKNGINNPSGNSKGEINPDEWTFDVRISKNGEGEVEEVRKPVKRSVVAEAKEEREKKLKEKLFLEETPKETLTRRQMAERMKKEENTEDVFVYANPINRGIAEILDILFVGVVSYVLKFLLGPLFLLNTIILNKYNYQLDVSKSLYVYNGQFIVLGLMYFIFIVIGTAFYNKTVGKKMMGLVVRNDDRFSLNLTDIFVREVVLKPISVISVIGIIMPFFHKQKKSLHDVLMKTLVIES